MKEAGYDHWYSPNTGATNSSGFIGLPGGKRGFGTPGNFWHFGNSGSWWSSSESSSSPIHRIIYFKGEHIGGGNSYSGNGFSARCVRD
jgi:uncharacterized protein (TIGR02145 family)